MLRTSWRTPWATSRLAFVADVAPVEQRGRALALVGGSSRVGMTLGPILGGVLGETFGIEAAFFGHAVMATLALVLVGILPEGDLWKSLAYLIATLLLAGVAGLIIWRATR